MMINILMVSVWLLFSEGMVVLCLGGKIDGAKENDNSDGILT